MTGRLIKSENNSIGKDYYIINLSEIEPSVYTLLTFDKDHSVLWKDKIVKR